MSIKNLLYDSLHERFYTQADVAHLHTLYLQWCVQSGQKPKVSDAEQVTEENVGHVAARAYRIDLTLVGTDVTAQLIRDGSDPMNTLEEGQMKRLLKTVVLHLRTRAEERGDTQTVKNLEG